MRYFAELAYNGAGYQGWQKQKNEAPTLQEEIERALSTLINHPTRITPTSSISIDHIWTNITSNQILSGILTDNIADHLPVFQITEMDFSPKTTQNSNRIFSIKRG